MQGGITQHPQRAAAKVPLEDGLDVADADAGHPGELGDPHVTPAAVRGHPGEHPRRPFRIAGESPQ